MRNGFVANLRKAFVKALNPSGDSETPFDFPGPSVVGVDGRQLSLEEYFEHWLTW